MTKPEFHISLSPIDEAHFGFKTASAAYVESGNVAEMLEFCREEKVELLIARCAASSLEAVQRMEAEGFQLMDTLLYFKLKIRNTFPYPESKSIHFRPVKQGEEDRIKEITAAAFEDYYGHYQADQRISKSKADEVYVKWAYQACLTQSDTKVVLAAEKVDELLGYVIIEIDSPTDATVPLACVDPAYQRTGVYSYIAQAHWDWLRRKGVKFSNVSTQITNIMQHRYLIRFGYEPTHAVYTLHKWFD